MNKRLEEFILSPRKVFRVTFLCVFTIRLVREILKAIQEGRL